MKECMQFYINGEWVDPVDPKSLDVINPATEEVIGKIAMGNSQDVDKAVAAAKEAFESFSKTTSSENSFCLRLLRFLEALGPGDC